MLRLSRFFPDEGGGLKGVRLDRPISVRQMACIFEDEQNEKWVNTHRARFAQEND